MNPHLIDGEFQSDKYPTCPRGKVPLSVKDPTAQDLLFEYAQRRRPVDAEFSSDLEEALRIAGYDPSRRLPFRTREYPVSNCWLIVCTSNLGYSGERPGHDEEIIAGIPDRVAADMACDAINDRCSGDKAPWHYKVEPDGYDLKVFKP